jgi:cyclic pyranopterin phosphate synthase
MKNLSHLDEQNKPKMVDVTDKEESYRIAQAHGSILINRETIDLIVENKIKKGNVLITAELAGVQAAKKTWDLIPLCHNLILSNVHVDARILEDGVEVISEVKCIGQTGVEMEALTAVSIALLTIYDMCKAADKGMIIREVKLIKKEKTRRLV